MAGLGGREGGRPAPICRSPVFRGVRTPVKKGAEYVDASPDGLQLARGDAAARGPTQRAGTNSRRWQHRRSGATATPRRKPASTGGTSAEELVGATGFERVATIHR